MTTPLRKSSIAALPSALDASVVLEALPQAVIVVGANDRVVYANSAAEALLRSSAAALARRTLRDLLPPHHRVLDLVSQVAASGESATEYGIDLTSPVIGAHPDVDVTARPLPLGQGLAVTFSERSVMRSLERRHAQHVSARSMVGLASVLAHEIKNPLSGIRGAAQLLEADVTESGRNLTRLICTETDRICNLVDRMTEFGSPVPAAMTPVNIHAILQHVRHLAASGFARHVQFVEAYDPSLPPVIGHHDQLVQTLINLVKNAAEAIGPDRTDGRIVLGTSYRPGLKLRRGSRSSRAHLPLIVTVADNGPGIPESIESTLFEPFVTTKTTGSGLGLALVAKVVEDHGGHVELERSQGTTTVTLLLPIADEPTRRAAGLGD